MGGVFSDGEFQTIQKTRIIARPRHQQIVRLDREKNGAIREPTLKKLRQFVLQRAGRCDGVVISDYGKGVVHERLLAAVTELVERRKLIYVVDPKKENYARYRSPSLITPNKNEAGEAAGIDILDDATLVAAGGRLYRCSGAEKTHSVWTAGDQYRPCVPHSEYPLSRRYQGRVVQNIDPGGLAGLIFIGRDQRRQPVSSIIFLFRINHINKLSSLHQFCNSREQPFMHHPFAIIRDHNTVTPARPL